jgi:hypothetical protein
MSTPTPEQAAEIAAAKVKVSEHELAVRIATEQLNASKAMLVELEKPFKPAAASLYGPFGFGAPAPAPKKTAPKKKATKKKVPKKFGKVLRDNIQSITKYSLCALAASAEITNISSLFFEEIRGILKFNVENLIRDTITITEHCR